MPDDKRKVRTIEEARVLDIFETYMPIEGWTKTNLVADKPTAFNGFVRVRRYRITVEEVIDGKQGERLQQLWDQGDNWHHRLPIQSEADKIGYTLKGQFGARRER